MTFVTFTTEVNEQETNRSTWQAQVTEEGIRRVSHIFVDEAGHRQSNRYSSLDEAPVPDEVLRDWASVLDEASSFIFDESMYDFEEEYDRLRDVVADWTTDELYSELDHLTGDPNPQSVRVRAKKDAIRAELEERGEE